MIADYPLPWPLVPLSAVAKLIRGVTFSGAEAHDSPRPEHVPILRAGNISDRLITETDLVWVPKSRVSDEQFLRVGDIAICMSSGSAAVVGKNAALEQDWKGSVGAFCAIIRPTGRIDPRYLASYLKGSQFTQWRKNQAQGANIQNLRGSELLVIPIPLPPLSEQQRIVEIMQEAEAIRRLRAEAEAKTAELVPAIFAATFGDLYFGKSPFPVQPLSSIGELDRGKSRHRPRDEPSLYGGPYPFLQTGDVAQANGWITNYTQTYSEKGLEQSRLWPKGTLAITIAANIGSTAILAFDACFPDSVVGFTPNNGISVEYVRWWLLGYQKKLEIQAPQGAQKNINLEVLRSIQIPVPPLELQFKFQAAIQNLRDQINSAAAGTKTFIALSASISANAFSGQLTADWREANQDQLVIEARERDAALRRTLTLHPHSAYSESHADIVTILQHSTDGIYSDLNREQRHLLRETERMVGGVRYVRYFTAKQLSEYISDGPLRRNPQAIEGHLAVLAARGLIIPVSREEQTEDTGEFVFGNAYRLPLKDFEPKDDSDGEPVIGDHDRLREMERLASQLEREGGLK